MRNLTVSAHNPAPEILFEDPHILVCVKPAGVPVQTRRFAVPDLESILKNHLAGQSAGAPYLAVIHRLDQPVCGILVFAKTPAAARDLNRQLQSDGFSKQYRALLCGAPAKPKGVLEDYLLKDGRANTSRVCTPDTPGAKRAELSYKILGDLSSGDLPSGDLSSGNLPSGDLPSGDLPSDVLSCDAPRTPRTPDLPAQSLTEVEIHLKTGRHHQIRVQFAAAGTPLWGDTKYNPAFAAVSGCQLALCACDLTFRHPVTHKTLHFSIPCPWAN